MSVLDKLRTRLYNAVADLTNDPDAAVEMLRPTQDPRFGDYQANCAMSLATAARKPPRQIATDIVAKLQIDDLCEPIEIAGPGFINFKLKDTYVAAAALDMLRDDALGLLPVPNPRTVVVDFSSPNVAKPMHVGHIRSTVIGDAISKILRARGHQVITDNHLGDWGTQYGMIIYGYKHFRDDAALKEQPVAELSRLYRYVNDLIGYHDAVRELPVANQKVNTLEAEVEKTQAAVQGGDKKAEKNLRAVQRRLAEAIDEVKSLTEKISRTKASPKLLHDAEAHPQIGTAVLLETSRLHAGDEENLQLWRRFMPYCLNEIQRVYERLNISFDHQLGESFYHDQLADVVDQLKQRGLAVESDGAICVFIDGFDAPMIVRKQDGAYLYATTDLATLEYRKQHFHPDEVLYVVDHRQSEHFEKLFAVAAKSGYESMALRHISFGTVLGKDGKPFKTRSGSSVGLEALLDDAIAEAMKVVCAPERIAKYDPPLGEAELNRIADVVGHGAIKYFDLVHNRTSDYVFDLKQMVSLDGNTSAYTQYAYARVQGLLRAAETSENEVMSAVQTLLIQAPHERRLAMMLLQYGEAIDQVLVDYRPNILVDYLYEVAKAFSGFFENCPVLKADPEVRISRLALAVLTGRVIKQGLKLLGIDVLPRM